MPNRSHAQAQKQLKKTKQLWHEQLNQPIIEQIIGQVNQRQKITL